VTREPLISLDTIGRMIGRDIYLRVFRRRVYRRRSARVLLLDDAGRILLLRCMKDPGHPELGHCWVTPGGGVRRWEPLARAAARELSEEIGLTVASTALGRPVAEASGYADLGWAKGYFRDDFFHHRVSGHEVDTSRMERLERDAHAGHRWWTVAELATTDEEVFPLGLAPLVTGLSAGQIPQQPVRLPWHH
jgi:8-oxo-dGTP pyrophosphatase MutT (NUDIX family)